MSYLVGAYAAFSGVRMDAELEDGAYALLSKHPHVSGFEIPFLDRRTADPRRITRHLGASKHSVLTTIPGVVAAARRDSTFGLASIHERGRNRAIAQVAEALSVARRVNGELGRLVIGAIHVASAPRQSRPELPGGADLLAESLAELLSWEWNGIRLVLEHCDALNTSHEPAKGFLTLDSEIAAITKAQIGSMYRIGVCINWGRSVIETRDCDTVPRHLSTVRRARMLAGAVFSGCSSQPTIFGSAWADAHLPPAPDGAAETGMPLSLMTKGEISRCLQEIDARESVYVGLKVSAPRYSSIAARIGLVEASLSVLHAADQNGATKHDA